MFKKNINWKDFLFESFIGTSTLFLIFLLVLILLVIFLLPINNYHRAQGVVEYKNQYIISSQSEGVIQEILVTNKTMVRENTPILTYYSKENKQEISNLNIKINFLENEYNTLSRLYETGSIHRQELDRKSLEIKELTNKRKFLEKNIISSPVSGLLCYTILPEYIGGTYITKGEIIGYVYPVLEKHIKISFPNHFADRFEIGGKVIFKYRDPVSFTTKKIIGTIYRSFINENDKTLSLFCRIPEPNDAFDLLQPATVLDSYVTINSTSLSQDLFGFDIFPNFFKLFNNSIIYETINKIIE
jgi:hypothetical protein